MDNFFQMHNQMAQQFFAQAERDFQRFVEPPRRRAPMRQQSIKKQQSQHQDYRPRGKIDYDNNNNNTYRPLNNFNKNNNSNFNDYKQPEFFFFFL